MRFGAGVITVAGSLGILMLPSIPKVIYAISTNTSIGALFVAGLLPGTLLTIMLCAVTWYIARQAQLPAIAQEHVDPVRGAPSAQSVLGPDAGRHHHRRYLQRACSPRRRQPPWPPSTRSSCRCLSTRL